MHGMSRRALLAAAATAALAPARSATGAVAAASPRVVAMDFGLAETLIAMGVAPIALPDPDSWADWVVEPALPPGIVNLGTDREPNLELLAASKPDLIVTTPYLAGIQPLLDARAPTRTISVYAPPVGHPYDRSVTATHQLAGLVGCEAEGAALIAAAEAELAAKRQSFADRGLAGQRVMVVNFLDPRHVRIYGAGSLFDDVLLRCGLANGWSRPSNYWGFSTVGIEALAETPPGRLIYLEPISADTLGRLAESPLWNSLPFVRAGRVHRMPAVLMFGMLPSAMRFARLLEQTLTAERIDG